LQALKSPFQQGFPEDCRKEAFHFSQVVNAIMMRLSEVVSRHLRAGDIVQLREWGRLKLEIESEKVDRPEEFHPKKHIRSVRLHIIPESENGKPVLYKDIEFKKEKI
jgi:hypothetical protein